MSSNLYWEPVKPKLGNDLTDTTKFFLKDMYEYEGSPLDIVLRADQKSFLSGAMAATRCDELKSDLEEILKAIDKYGEIRIWEQY